jgi:hypothetical protein
VAARQAAFLQILLVIILSLVEGAGRDNLRHYRFRKPAGAGKRLFGSLGGGFLLGRMEENSTAILGSRIWALPV